MSPVVDGGGSQDRRWSCRLLLFFTNVTVTSVLIIIRNRIVDHHCVATFNAVAFVNYLFATDGGRCGRISRRGANDTLLHRVQLGAGTRRSQDRRLPLLHSSGTCCADAQLLACGRKYTDRCSGTNRKLLSV
uniref:Uncharacterized protein n=1 Tax=Anopheles atroparvus TaxID=41427 RepID=A0A182JKV4_ANOAO